MLKPELCTKEGNNLVTDVQKAVSLFWKAAKLMLLYSELSGSKIACDLGFLRSGNSPDCGVEYFPFLRKITLNI